MADKKVELEIGSVVIGLIALDEEIRKMVKNIMTEDPSTKITQEELECIKNMIQKGITNILTPVDMSTPEGFVKLLNLMKGK